MAALIPKSEREFSAFYTASYGRLVATVGTVTRSRVDAEEAVQEAFERLVPRWEKVSKYDDPEAWVRSVAFRISVSRWRRARSHAAAMLRHKQAGPVPPPSDDNMYVTALLASLTPEHRQVLVLYYGLEQSVDQIARQLRVAPGTVKSRLSRAREAAKNVGE